MSMGYERSGRKQKLIRRLVDVPAKPDPLRGLTDDRKWNRNEADERAYAAGYRFNERLAMHMVDFFPHFLCHSQGKWAGEPFDLDPWHRDEVVMPLAGWVHPETGLRRFRQTYIEEPKKQGKSTIAAGIGLYGLVADGEAGAHIYSFGADKEQARVVHREAIDMIDWSPGLAEALDINRTTGVITYRATRSFYQAVSGSLRGKHGIKMHFGILDELHEWYGRKLWDQLKFAGRSRDQPIRFVITNAGDDEESVCFEQRAKALRVESGEITDHTFLAHVLRVPEDDARAEIDSVATSPHDSPPKLDVARRCNVNLGTIVAESDLVQDIRDAVETPSEIPNLLRLTYGIWVSSADLPLLPSGAWDRCCKPDEQLEGLACSAGLDLGETSDFSAFSIAGVRLNDDGEREYVVRCWYWLPRAAVKDTKNKYAPTFMRWAQEERAQFTLTPGDTTDFGVLREDIVRLCDQYEVETLVYDPRRAEKLTQEVTEGVMTAAGAVVIDGTDYTQRISFAQSVANYAEPTEEFERAVINERVYHDGNPALRWQAGHCSYVMRDGCKKPIKPGNDHDPRTIDGVQSTVMAIAGAMQLEAYGSAYAEPGKGVVLY